MLTFFWPINEAFMEGVRGRPIEHPYVVGLKLGIEETVSEFACERDLCECGVL